MGFCHDGLHSVGVGVTYCLDERETQEREQITMAFLEIRPRGPSLNTLCRSNEMSKAHQS